MARVNDHIRREASDTALRAAFAKAGYAGGRDRLFLCVAELLRDARGDQIQARRKLIAIFQRDSDLLISAADFCVRIVAADMEGTSLPGGGHVPNASDGHHLDAPDRQFNNGAPGHEGHARKSYTTGARPPSPEASGEGHVSHARKSQSIPAPSARPDTPERRAARVNVVLETAQKLTELDSFKIRDGRSIGNISWGELGKLKGQNAHEAWVIKLVIKHAQIEDQSRRVRDVITAEDLARIIQKAAELSDEF